MRRPIRSWLLWIAATVFVCIGAVTLLWFEKTPATLDELVDERGQPFAWGRSVGIERARALPWSGYHITLYADSVDKFRDTLPRAGILLLTKDSQTPLFAEGRFDHLDTRDTPARSSIFALGSHYTTVVWMDDDGCVERHKTYRYSRITFSLHSMNSAD